MLLFLIFRFNWNLSSDINYLSISSFLNFHLNDEIDNLILKNEDFIAEVNKENGNVDVPITLENYTKSFNIEVDYLYPLYKSIKGRFDVFFNHDYYCNIERGNLLLDSAINTKNRLTTQPYLSKGLKINNRDII